MKAVNLIPLDQRRHGAAGRSGGVVYGVLGALGLVVLLVAALALVDRQAGDRQTELDGVLAETAQVQAQVDALAAYRRFATLATERQATVSGLVSGRFDWAHVLREVARVVPANVSLEALEGTTGAAGAADGPGGAANAPVVTLRGCTTSQTEVARLLARLRSLDGVERVALVTSERPEGEGEATARCGRNRPPTFELKVRFRPTAGLTAAQVAAPATPAPVADTPSTGSQP